MSGQASGLQPAPLAVDAAAMTLPGSPRNVPSQNDVSPGAPSANLSSQDALAQAANPQNYTRAEDGSVSTLPGGAESASQAARRTAPKMEGHFNRHTSGYWAVMIPALSLRYMPEAAMKFGVAKKPGNTAWAEKLDTAYAAVTGAAMMMVTSFYARKTYQDIKNVFAEPIAWETGKNPEDVTFRDIMKSDNTLVEAARRNFLKYNARRYAVNMPFFSKHIIKDFSGDAAVGFGVAANSMYLVRDVFKRKETFFERVQSFVDQKISHTSQLGDTISGIDLINLYELAHRDKDPGYSFSGRMDTPEWQNRLKIFDRMADLMNQTYGNEPNREHANFTLAKMIYMMGHGMIGAGGDTERSCMLIEVANHDGIEAVKDVVAHGRDHNADMIYAKQRYLSNPPCETPVQQPKPGFAEKFAASAAMSNGEKILNQRAASNDGSMAQTA